jgi:hypothetical protein
MSTGGIVRRDESFTNPAFTTPTSDESDNDEEDDDSSIHSNVYEVSEPDCPTGSVESAEPAPAPVPVMILDFVPSRPRGTYITI